MTPSPRAGIVVLSTTMALFHKDPRMACTAKNGECGPGQDPLVDDCCVFWCCGVGQADGTRLQRSSTRSKNVERRELPDRPYVGAPWDARGPRGAKARKIYLPG